MLKSHVPILGPVWIYFMLLEDAYSELIPIVVTSDMNTFSCVTVSKNTTLARWDAVKR